MIMRAGPAISRAGNVVLDLGDQPACDYFPRREDPGPDPLYPLQMWLCSTCGLAQLADDATVPEEPRGTEPAALVAQAASAVDQVAAAGLLPDGGGVAEYGSPHGGSWLELLAARGLTSAHGNQPAEVVMDCFGLMHCANQSAALNERIARVAAGGVLLLQFHSLDTILRRGQWNALRHGHYAYYSTTALVTMLAGNGFIPFAAWNFELYGGTVLLAARRDVDGTLEPGDAVRSLLAKEARAGVVDPSVFAGLQYEVELRGKRLQYWSIAERSLGRKVLGYGAASPGCRPLAPGGSRQDTFAGNRGRLSGKTGSADARHRHPCRGHLATRSGTTRRGAAIRREIC